MRKYENTTKTSICIKYDQGCCQVEWALGQSKKVGPFAPEVPKFVIRHALFVIFGHATLLLKEVSQFLFTGQAPVFIQNLRKFLDFTGREQVMKYSLAPWSDT